MEDQCSSPIPYFEGEATSAKDAARKAHVSTDTIIRWAIRHGIGRQLDGRHSGWKVSKPALLMLLAQDDTALKAYRAGDRINETVLRYFDLAECPRPKARQFSDQYAHVRETSTMAGAA